MIKLLKEILIPGITVITGAMVAYLNFTVSEVDSKLKESKELRAERESQKTFDLKIYDKVIESLESHDAKKQEVAKALVIVMASPDLRDNLLNVLGQAGTDDVRKDVTRIIEEEKAFKTEQQAIALPATNAVRLSDSDWRAFSYDIFWCEESGENARGTAEEVVRLLKLRGVKGRLRVRKLPVSVNARKGYQIAGYVIRANADEQRVADEFKAFADSSLVNTDFIITFSRQPTPLYMSAFICP